MSTCHFASYTFERYLRKSQACGPLARLIPILQAILFDCDGVIADSEAHWNEIDAQTLEHYGVSGYRGEHKENVLGKSFALSSAFYIDFFGLKTTVEEFVNRRTQVAIDFYSHRIPAYEDAPGTLAALKQSGFRVALATSSVSRLIAPFLRRCNIEEYFDAIITGEMVTNGKPHPDIYLLAASRVGVEPARCLVVEDALSGLQAGRAAGARTVAIPDARWLNPALFAGAADYQVDCLGEVVPLALQLRAAVQ